MCQAKIWLKVKGEEREWLRDITHLEVQGEELIFKTFFAPPKTLRGKVLSIDFLKGKVLVECDAFPE